MISSATVQSAIVLTNRRMKTERGVITFVPVCSSVAGMHLHHLEGRRAAQEWSARFEETADPPTPPSSTVTGYTDVTDGKETGGRRTPPSAFCLYRRNGGASSCERMRPGVRRAPPSNFHLSDESEEQTPKAPTGENLRSSRAGAYEPAGATGLARLKLRARVSGSFRI